MRSRGQPRYSVYARSAGGDMRPVVEGTHFEHAMDKARAAARSSDYVFLRYGRVQDPFGADLHDKILGEWRRGVLRRKAVSHPGGYRKRKRRSRQ